MPAREAELYRRGKYWLGPDRRADGTLRSPNLTIFWYDPAARRVRSNSARTSALAEARVALDRLYLADVDEAPSFCPTCGQPTARADAYLLADAIADYRLEHADALSSADSIAARLKHVVDYLVAENRAAATCADASSPIFAQRFRTWSAKQPATWRNKQGAVTVSRPRSPATTEESVLQLCAVLNHAVASRRSDARPMYAPIGRKRVTSARRVRVDVPVLADMLAYAAEQKRRRGTLHAFLVASICTLARPDTVVDISVAPGRRQWWRGSPTIDLNPAGRAQTKKHRPIVPVAAPLADWLLAELAEYEALDKDEQANRGWLVNYFGRPVRDVDRAWDTMLEKLSLPREREWRPYLIRHSMATILRGRSVPKWELAGMTGHGGSDQIETYAVGGLFPNAFKALADVLGEIEQRSPGALHRSGTGAGLSVLSARRR